MAQRRAELLVSVRSPNEAEAALAGLADIIDVKEPDHGSLGRASDQTIIAVLDRVAGRRPVSAALGELVEETPPFFDPRLSFLKWGLAGCRSLSWQSKLRKELARPGKPQTVIVAYADWQCAQSPPVEDVVAFACVKAGNVLLIDTHCKEPVSARSDRRPNLLDWLPVPDVVRICRRCRAAGVRVALAGSLGLPEIEQLRGAHPSWFAVRGAVCTDNNRSAAVDIDKVRVFARILKDFANLDPPQVY